MLCQPNVVVFLWVATLLTKCVLIAQNCVMHYFCLFVFGIKGDGYLNTLHVLEILKSSLQNIVFALEPAWKNSLQVVSGS